MRFSTITKGLSVSTLAIAMATTPVFAQKADTPEAQSTAEIDIALDGELSDDEKTLVVAGAIGAAGKQIVSPSKGVANIAKQIGEARRSGAPASKVRQLPTSTNIAGQNLRQTATSTRPTSLRDLQARGEAAKAARANRIAGSADELAELERRGNAAQNARTKPAGTARPTNARPANIANSDLGRVVEKGEAAQNARAKPAGARTPAARPANIANSNLGRVIEKGEAAQNARRVSSNRTAADVLRARDAAEGPRNIRKIDAPASNRAAIGKGSQLDDLVARGNKARSSREALKASGQAVRGEQALGRKLIGKGADVPNLLAKGDAAQAMRKAAPINEAQLMRGIADQGGDITKLNKAGRTAQAARGAGGLKAAKTSTQAAKAVQTSAKAAKAAKMAKTGATVGKAGKGARAVVAGSGIGLVALAAEAAGKESVKALTGAEIQDPLSTGFQYGAAIFDKDVSMKDVWEQRREHHKENWSNVKATFTEKGRFKQNLQNYGAEKREQFARGVEKTAEFGRKVDAFDRNARNAIEGETGVKLERSTDVAARYGAALQGDKKLKAFGEVAKSRAQHHLSNAKAATNYTTEKVREAGAQNRAAVGQATGADLRSVRETTSRYAEAAKSEKPVAGVASVAADRAKHHTDNAKKVTGKVLCGVGNIFRKKDKDKDCKK